MGKLSRVELAWISNVDSDPCFCIFYFDYILIFASVMEGFKRVFISMIGSQQANQHLIQFGVLSRSSSGVYKSMFMSFLICFYAFLDEDGSGK